GFAVTTPTPSWASTVSVVSAAAAASFSSTPCNVVNAPATATCSDSSPEGSASSFADLTSGPPTFTASASGVNSNASATLTTVYSLTLPAGYTDPNVFVMATLTGNGGSVSGNAFLETELSISNGTGSQGTICSGSFTCTSTPLDLSVTTNVPVDSLTITVF